jgi:GAF domain-containing protein
MPEIDPLERLSRGLTQWERELLREPRSPSRSRAATDLDRITHILQAARSITGTLDINELLVRVVDAVIQVADADRGFLMLMREDGKLHFEVARNKDESTLPSDEFQISWGIAEEAAHRRETVWVPDAVGSSLFQDRKSVRELSLRTVVALPILSSGRVLGVLQLKDIVQVTVSKTNPDKEQAKRLNEVLTILIEERGYTEQSARDLLDYVGHLLNR